MLNSPFFIIRIFALFLCVHGFAQQSVNVENILEKAQAAIDNQVEMSNKLQYNFYPTYAHSKPTESYGGKIIKNGNTHYTKINETIFLTNIKDNKSLKLNKEEKIILIGENNIANTQSTVDLLGTFIKYFKTKNVKDKGTYWLCTLTTDVITQLPYGRVEIYIDKANHRITKQVLYFLVQYPYKNKNGDTVMDNPKLEVLISDYNSKITKEEALAAKFSSYISYNNSTVKPVSAYEDFKVIQN